MKKIKSSKTKKQTNDFIVCDKCGFSSKDEKRFSYNEKTLCNFCD